jgi:FdhD protein
MTRVVQRRPVLRLTAGEPDRRAPDSVAGEEPLEIRVAGRPFAVAMRTPGANLDLPTGFLVSEGVISRSDQLRTIRYCTDNADIYNVVEVSLADGVTLPPHLERSTYVSSSCGVCGKASVDGVRTTSAYDVARDDVRVPADVLRSLPATLRATQDVFDKTGGLHAAGLFTADGTLLCVREDVGRHNAVDKVVGWALREQRLPLAATVLLVSGRASFELAQKAVMAGIPVLAAVSAPSSLAVDLAVESGLTLVGFLRGPSMNVYAGHERLT